MFNNVDDNGLKSRVWRANMYAISIRKEQIVRSHGSMDTLKTTTTKTTMYGFIIWLLWRESEIGKSSETEQMSRLSVMFILSLSVFGCVDKSFLVSDTTTVFSPLSKVMNYIYSSQRHNRVKGENLRTKSWLWIQQFEHEIHNNWSRHLSSCISRLFQHEQHIISDNEDAKTRLMAKNCLIPKTFCARY